MIVLSILAAGLAGYLQFGSSGSRRARRRLGATGIVVGPGRPKRRWIKIIGPPMIMIGPPALVGLTLGRQGFWLCVPVMIIGGTAALIVAQGRRRRDAQRERRHVAQACSVLAGQVRIGQPPLVSLQSAAADCPVLRPAVATAHLGGDVVACWHAQAIGRGRSGLADLARAWQLSAATGSGMAEALDDVAEGLAADESLGLVVDSEAAGPRASGKVMATLPVIGVALGYLIGGDPIAFLINTPAGWGCLTAGAVLVSAGVLWMERVADHASSWR